jgi:uroporphyrinogen-III synthase
MRDVGSLVGYTVAVTAVRRRLEFGTALERRGARIVYAPAMQIVVPSLDTELQDATKSCLDVALDIVVATTAMGVRAWLDAAEEWGLSETLRARLGAASIVARSVKVLPALRAGGVAEAWTSATESDSDLLAHLLERDLRGLRIAVQLHGDALTDLVDTLRAAGAEVFPIVVYRSSRPAEPEPVEQLARAVAEPGHSAVDAIAFTSGAAVTGLLRAASDADCHELVVHALRTRVVAACVGPVTSAPLLRLDVPVVQPTRYKLGSLVREISERVPARRGVAIAAAGHHLDIRGHVVVMDGVVIPLGWSAMGVLRELARYPGRIVATSVLLGALGPDADSRALEAEIAGLRTTLGDSRLVQGVVGPGYRLAFETEAPSSCGHEGA